MKIYSWNMLFRNRELDRAFDFISKTDFDIFCLQEVPETFLTRLRTLPFHMVDAVDVDRLFARTNRNHLVILSRYPISGSGSIPWPDYWPLLPLRTKLFVRLMRPLHWSKIKNRNSLYADLMVKESPVRIFNLHTALTKPDLRIREFERVLAERDPSHATIVCGDFNLIESPHMSLLNWFVGGSIADTLFYRRERTRIEKRFVEHKLINPLRGEITHPFSGSQLDHILVSHSFTIKNVEVLSDRIGSDHHPIRVEVE